MGIGGFKIAFFFCCLKSSMEATTSFMLRGHNEQQFESSNQCTYEIYTVQINFYRHHRYGRPFKKMRKLYFLEQALYVIK
jgi:hypothetical protein